MQLFKDLYLSPVEQTQRTKQWKIRGFIDRSKCALNLARFQVFTYNLTDRARYQMIERLHYIDMESISHSQWCFLKANYEYHTLQFVIIFCIAYTSKIVLLDLNVKQMKMVHEKK